MNLTRHLRTIKCYMVLGIVPQSPIHEFINYSGGNKVIETTRKPFVIQVISLQHVFKKKKSL